jgi:sugar phosphate isomerase/epimerase
MRISTTTCDYYSADPNLVSPADAVRMLAGTGFTALDCSFNHLGHETLLGGKDWKRMVGAAGEEAARHGMVFTQAHTPMGPTLDEGLSGEQFLELTRRSLEGAAMLGVKWTVIHVDDIPGPYSREHIAYTMRRNLAFFRKLYPTMEKHGIGILVENTQDRHAVKPNRRRFCSTAEEILDAMHAFDHPLVGTCWDVGHAHAQSVDHYQAIMMLGKTLKGIHVHDNNGVVDQHLLPFQGTMVWEPFIKALADSGYEGDFTFEACTSVTQVPAALRRRVSELMYHIGLSLLGLDKRFETVR